MKKGKIIQYAMRSELMNVKFSYGDEEYSFNLFSELVVNENVINKEIKEQPSSYAFLGMLHKKLIRIAKDKERQAEKIWSGLYIMNKEKLDDLTGRPTTNELAKEKATYAKKYQEAIKAQIAAEHNAGVIEVCVKSFEQRSNLIQTLSANIRKTN